MPPLKLQSTKHRGSSFAEGLSSAARDPLSEQDFRRVLALERKRTERSSSPFILALVEANDEHPEFNSGAAFNHALSLLTPVIRETDAVGWLETHRCLGIIFTGLLPGNWESTLIAIKVRANALLRRDDTSECMQPFRLSFHVFPDDWNHDPASNSEGGPLYSDLSSASKRRKGMLRIKRMMDITGASILLLALSPLFLLIAAAIRLTSPGPVFFRQERVGQYGKRFTFLKFRSMYVGNDHSSHQGYVEQLISGIAKPMLVTRNGESVYKLADDNRITKLGRFLRRSSLDELPQFLNVLRGDMSLVGPRPPIPYETAAYRTWHRRRLLQVKPGITGLWQVTSRSRVGFDEMVRLDLQYASTWSPWLDLKILLRTPAAVLKGAY